MHGKDSSGFCAVNKLLKGEAISKEGVRIIIRVKYNFIQTSVVTIEAV